MLNLIKIDKIIKEEIEKVINNKVSKTDLLIQYIKSFGNKGKLPSFEGDLRQYYEPCLKDAYSWASEKIEDIKREGFAYFRYLFGIYFKNNIKQNKRGLIYVERSIDIDLNQDLANLDYSSIGECWSWKKSNGQAYCTSYNFMDKYKNHNIETVTICGYVHPDSIDWLETVYLNSYDMKNETEVRMNDNALVEVSYLMIGTAKYRFGSTFLINASSDKSREKNW